MRPPLDSTQGPGHGREVRQRDADQPNAFRRQVDRTDQREARPVADSHRLTLQCWVIPLLDRSIESVHVNVDDLASLPFNHSHGTIAWGMNKRDTLSTPKDAEADAWFACLHLLLLLARAYSGHE
ncbi:hypothetical protein CHELA40_12499 [Chelatococcus asaccharovorans]|nr:hypothetical protein CHELA40_12499 [Chelatococcus asaccharovorans]